MERISDLLRGNYWMLDLTRISLTDLEIDFLSHFFTIKREIYFDELNNFEREFLILIKKPKFLTLH